MPKKRQKPNVGPSWKKQLEKRNDFGRKKRIDHEGRLKLENASV